MSKIETMDGNQAASHISYAFTEVAAIFPITPSTTMAENVDEMSSRGIKNIFGQPVKVVEMQSEAGAAGAMHGSLQAGALTSTYTASQGLLLMIPNLYKMTGELLPGVLHVSARAIATHALSIFGDHQDVMAVRPTGVAMLASSNVQEVMDLGCITHLSAIRARVPFIHFFDGFRTSHEYQKIQVISYEDAAKLVDWDAVKQFRDRALNPEHPVVRGTAQNPDIYFQGREVQNPFFNNIPDIVNSYMRDLQKVTGRCYKPFDYYGAQDAEHVIIAMGSVCDTIDETVDYMNANGAKVGAVHVHLYRPFCEKYLFDMLPNTVTHIAVLDRTKEPGASAEPLYLDVLKAFKNSAQKPLIVGGRYGLGSKDTPPSQIISVFRNLMSDTPKDSFTIGIIDDVTYTSLPESEPVETVPKGTVSCKIWGLGSDGTVGANKSAIKIIGDNTDLFAQGYFSYDSKKSGGTTTSHLRFGKAPIRSPYLVYSADYIACHNKSFLYNYDILKGIKRGGIFLLNCPWGLNELDEHIPASIKKDIADNDVKFYIIDAVKIASEIGLGNRINMIMQAAFFKLINVIEPNEAFAYLKKAIEKSYGRKGQDVVAMNKTAVDRGADGIISVTVPTYWRESVESETQLKDEPHFIRTIQRKMARQEGDELSVSAFVGMEDGTYPLGITSYEKRGIAVIAPQWQKEKCIQCGFCAYICPHATIRTLLLDEQENKDAPEKFTTLPATGKGLEGMYLRVQVSPLDCTGCGNCADICPAKGKALIMQPAEQEILAQAKNWEHSLRITEKDVDKHTIKGSQFKRPLLEFNGACTGCGETPYIRLLTQLFGERMMIANATGCSSIWGASSPSIAYTTNAKGKGPAWANSLFEDNAEYGFGMSLGVKQNRERLHSLMKELLTQDIDSNLKAAFSAWIDAFSDGEASKEASEKVMAALKQHDTTGNRMLEEIKEKQDYLVKKSIWLIGGDGWAYDIGFGGVDHVLAMGEDVNLFVMDTEVYSNTGGQASKSTPTAAVAKFASAGKKLAKKDLGIMAMSYGYVYVAQIAMGANMNQTLTAMTEAEKYKGPSLIIAYAPCISHGIKSGMGTSIAHEKLAVESGYWHLYRYNPELKKENKNPFMLDSKPPKSSYTDYLKGEIRYAQLSNTSPETAQELYKIAEENAKKRYERYSALAQNRIF